MTEQVVLVNEFDEAIGTMEKLEAHRQGVLHRAFSIFVFNDRNELLLQQRAPHKYHSGGLWTNTCCSHPRPDESVEQAAHRRLKEEMGFDCQMQKAFHFIYKVDLDNNLVEHELDHVLIGQYNQKPELNPDEATDAQFMALKTVQQHIAQRPEDFTYWFKIAIQLMADKKII